MALYACFRLNKPFGTLSKAESIPESFCFIVKTYRALSHDVRVTILVFQNNETAVISRSSKPTLWELNSFLLQTLSFVPIDLHRCCLREFKRSPILS